MKRKVYGLIIFITGLSFNLGIGQTYFMCQRVGFQDNLYKLKLNCFCEGCCDLHVIGPTGDFARGMTMSPDGKLYGCDWYNHIYEVDTLTGASTLIFTLPIEPKVIGLVTLGGGIFYTLLGISNDLGDTLAAIDVNTGMITKLGLIPDKAIGELTVFNGEIYYHWVFPDNWNIQAWGISKLNVNDPASSTPVVTLEYPCCFSGLTATNQCQTLLSLQVLDNDKLVMINLVDGAITEICDLPEGIMSFTSMEEFSSPAGCNTLDLDCNDSSGATDADFNAHEVNCLSNQCGVVDTDVVMIYDDFISMITVQLNGPLLDAPDEFLKYNGNTSEISVTGSNSDMITLTNEGTATSSDFRNALLAIHYTDVAIPVTPGPRTVKVEYTLESGIISNLATTYIDVIEFPVLQVDLGPDDVLCQGEKDTLDAGYPNALYHWSNNFATQTIITNQPGNYAVTVTKVGFCPGADTISVEVVPVIHVSLNGPVGICVDEEAMLIINTDSPFPLTIEIGTSTGSSFFLDDVTDNFSFPDFPTEATLYSILQVTPSSPACVEIQDSFQYVEVFPTYSMLADTSMCEGDSLFIANHWINQGGNFSYTYPSAAGCDSMVTTFVIVWPSIHINTQFTTCDSSAAGVFVTFLNNPSGCDTVVTKTITLLPPDTTRINLLSCNISNVGSAIQAFTSYMGCDSLIITTTSWIPPADTTLLNQITCDSAVLGVFTQFLNAQDGCDSIVITTVTMAASDTTYLSGISCDAASIGVFQNLLSNQMGCDSLVITSITAGMPDTTLIFKTSCDSSNLGVFEIHYMTPQGCDSLVVSTISFSPQDSTFIAHSSCNPASVGVFVQTLTNGFGCDSIVTTTISLLPSSESFISSTTCDPSSAGNFDHLLVNKFGCDSIVHETITLLPISETFDHDYTCDSSKLGTFVSTFQNQFGCDSTVTLLVEFNGSDTTELFSFTCDSNELSRKETLYSNQADCDSLVIKSTVLYPWPQLQLAALSYFNGFSISCFGGNDGSLIASVSGQLPFQYFWSTGDTTEIIKNLDAGPYGVTITDGNGCEVQGFIALTQPEEFTIGFEVAQPDCFGHNQGTITVMQSGGVLPVRYSIDGINFQSSPIFNALPAGTYTVTAIDANDCDVQEIIWINVPIDIHVDLGMDRIILPGDTTLLEAIVNVPFDSLSTIAWSGLINPNCPTCLTQPVAPIITTAYSISVSNSQGCSDQDSVVVFIQKNIDIYIPNVFSPNGDGINDRLLISAASEVEEIESMEIFDRWGNLVFAAKNFLPDDPTYAWDGRMRGAEMNPGVYAYRMMARFKDGRREVRNGDVTLIR